MKNNRNKPTANKGQYYMYGTHAVIAAAKNKARNIKQIFCLSKQAQELYKEIPDIPIEIVSVDFINQKIGKEQTHQGVIAKVNNVFKQGLESTNFTEDNETIAILDQITDPQNIGAIIRSAAAFGIKKIILPNDNTPDENATIAKTACGCLELVEVIKVTNLKQTIDKLKKIGFWIAGLDAKGKTPENSLSSHKKLAIIIGSEGKGMRPLTIKSCDFLVKIPMSDNVESLNASNAASIIFYLTKTI